MNNTKSAGMNRGDELFVMRILKLQDELYICIFSYYKYIRCKRPLAGNIIEGS